MILAVFGVLTFGALEVFAQGEPAAEAPPVQGFRTTALPLPRFVSLKSDKVYMRTGPGLRYPIKWVYTRENMPVEITQEFEEWRKVKDVDGEEGWINQAMLSGERTALVRADEPVSMREGESESTRLVARLEPLVVARLKKCDPLYCRLDAGGYEGWVERKFLWGIYPNENLN